jgi:hypothetical protein
MPGCGTLLLEASKAKKNPGGNMKTQICKRTVAVAITCLTLGAAALAQGGTCTNASLRGKYGQSISGELLPAPGVVAPQNGVAMTTFDGNGRFTKEDFIVINGAPVAPGFQSETGTYSINSDCTGTATINYSNGAYITLQLVVVNQGHEFRTVVSQLTMTGGGPLVPVNIGSNGVRVDTPTP